MLTQNRIKNFKNTASNNINLLNYSIEPTPPTEATTSGALLYINKKYLYKICPDLTIYKAKEPESIFIEIIHPKKSNIILGSICKHP